MTIRILGGLLLALGLAAPAWAQREKVETKPTLTALGQCATMDVGGYGTASIGITSIGTMTVTFYASNAENRQDAAALGMLPPGVSASSTSTATTVGTWSAGIASYRYVHACITAYTSGTLSVVMGAIGLGQGASTGSSSGSVSITQGGNTAAVNASSQLSITCANCTGSGVSQVDTTGFTPATSLFVPIGGEVDDVSTAALSEGQAGAARVTAQRALQTNLRNESGTELGTGSNPLRIDPTGTTAQPITDNSSSLTVDAPVNTPVYTRLSDGTNPITTLAVSLASVPSHAVTNAGTFATQVDGAALTALQLIDNLPNTIGSTTSGQSGVLTLCATTSAAPTNTTAQSNPFSCDTSGAIRVTGSSGTTQYNEDTASADAQALVGIGFVRRDTTPAQNAGAVGDWSWGSIDGNGRIYTQATLYNSSGTELTISADQTLDAALTTTGPLMVGRGSTATPTAMSADNDATAVWVDLNGRVHLAAEAAEDAASADAQFGMRVFAVRDDTLDARSGTEGDFEWFHTNANGALWTIDVNSAAKLTALQLIDDIVGVEDVGESDGGGLARVGSVRRDTAASSAGTTGDNATINTDALGRLWVSGAMVDDQAFTPATSIGLAIGGQADDTSTDSVDEGDFGAFRISLDRLLYVRMADPCSGGSTKLYLPFDITTATTTEITPSLAGASTHYYICALNIVTTAANNVNLVDDNSDNCASVTASLISTGLAAGDGWGLAANGGLVLGNGAGTIMRTQTSNSVLCLVTSAATELHGQFVVVAAP